MEAPLFYAHETKIPVSVRVCIYVNNKLNSNEIHYIVHLFLGSQRINSSNARRSRLIIPSSTEEILKNVVLPATFQMTPEARFLYCFACIHCTKYANTFFSQVEHYMLFETVILKQFIDKFNEEEENMKKLIEVWCFMFVFLWFSG